MVAFAETAILAVSEADIERDQHRQRRDDEVVHDDQNAARATQKFDHGAIIVQAGRQDEMSYRRWQGLIAGGSRGTRR